MFRMTTKKNNEIKITGESYTHYPEGKPDELTISTDDGRKVTVTENDLPLRNYAQAAEETKESVSARLRLEAERRLSEEDKDNE